MKTQGITRLVVPRGANEFALPPVWQKKPKPKLPPFKQIIAGMSVPQMQRLHARLAAKLAKLKAKR